MNPPDISNIGSTVSVMAAAFLFLAFLPVIVGFARRPAALQAAAALLCVLAGMIFSLGAATGFGAVVATPMAAVIWLAAFFCGLAAAIIGKMDAINREATYRLLNNDDRGLSPPPGFRRMPSDPHMR